MIGIYKITSPTGKIYIGQSINIEKRFKSYKYKIPHEQPRLRNSFLKHGIDKHNFEVLCECEIHELNDKERYYQDLFSATGKKGLNCSLTASSDRNGKASQETRLKMSITRTGMKQSKETCLKKSNSLKRKVINIETGEIYNSFTELAEMLNISKWTIQKRLNGQMKNNTNFKYL